MDREDADMDADRSPVRGRDHSEPREMGTEGRGDVHDRGGRENSRSRDGRDDRDDRDRRERRSSRERVSSCGGFGRGLERWQSEQSSPFPTSVIILVLGTGLACPSGIYP